MRKLPLICSLLVLLLAACGGKENPRVAHVSGEIKGLGDDTLYVLGMDRLFDRIDTLVVHGGKFSDTIPVDTLVGVRLLFGDGTAYPLYLDRRERIRISGSADRLQALQVTGSPLNEEQTAFSQSLAELPAPADTAVQRRAADFIRRHPASLVSLWLLEEYFVQVPDPDIDRIESLMEPLVGELKDRPLASELMELLEDHKKLSVGRSLPFIQTTDADGERIVRTQFKDQYLLLHVWASWDAASRVANDSLRALHRRQKRNKDFAMLGVSLDTDRAMWLDAVRRDTLEWTQGCDLHGWESDVVKKCYVYALPFNVLVNPKGRIMGINLTPAQVEEKIKKK